MSAENTIKTKLTLDGEKEFKRGISSINQELRLSSAQLKEAAATYALNGNAQQQLAEKSRILKDQIAAQTRIVEQYEKRMRQAEQATDLSADGLRNYGIQLTNAKTKLKQLEKEAKDTDRELEELGHDSRRAGNQLEENLGDAAEDVQDKFAKMAREVREGIGDLKDLQGVSIAVDLVRGAWDIAGSIADYVQSAVENGMQRAIVNYNWTKKGLDATKGTKIANEYAAIFGDTGGAYEAANLLAATFESNEIDEWKKFIGGAALTYNETLKPESLAEDIGKTITTGTLDGQAKALIVEMLGYNEETVNKALESARTKEERKVTLGAYFREAGLSEDYENFKKQNEALVESATALQEFNTALNNLAETTLPLLTPAVKGAAELFEKLETPLSSLISLLTPYDPNENPYEEDKKAIEEEKKRLYGENWTPPTEESKAEVEQPTSFFQRVGDAYLEGLDKLAATGTVGNFLAYALGRPAVAGGEGLDEVAGLKPNAEMSKYVTLAGQSAKSTQTSTGFGIEETVAADVEAAEQTAKAGGEAIGSNLTTGLQSQSLRLMLVAAQQRALLEKVWAEPIAPTVVVGYQMAGPVNKNPTSINVNVAPADVNVNGNTLAKVLFKPINTLLGLDAE